MHEIPLSQLDARQQRLVENARAALAQGNVGYAVDACAEILRAAPGCAEVRRLQRAAQLKRFTDGSRFVARALGGWSAAPFLFDRGRKSPAEKLEVSDRILASDPTNIAGLRLLAEAAETFEWRETAIFAREEIKQLNPQDRENLWALGRALLAAGRSTEALQIADGVLKARPVDMAALDLMRRASIAMTVSQGNWDVAGGLRSKPNPPGAASPATEPGGATTRPN